MTSALWSSCGKEEVEVGLQGRTEQCLFFTGKSKIIFKTSSICVLFGQYFHFFIAGVKCCAGGGPQQVWGGVAEAAPVQGGNLALPVCLRLQMQDVFYSLSVEMVEKVYFLYLIPPGGKRVGAFC